MWPTWHRLHHTMLPAHGDPDGNPDRAPWRAVLGFCCASWPTSCNRRRCCPCPLSSLRPGNSALLVPLRSHQPGQGDSRCCPHPPNPTGTSPPISIRRIGVAMANRPARDFPMALRANGPGHYSCGFGRRCLRVPLILSAAALVPLLWFITVSEE